MAVCAVLVGFVSVPVIELPLPATPPERPPDTAGASHVYVVPAGTRPSVASTGVTVNPASLQTAVARLLIAGLGLTVTTTSKGVPVQLPDFGVTEYVTERGPLVLLVSVPLILAAFVPAEAPARPAGSTGASHV